MEVRRQDEGGRIGKVVGESEGEEMEGEKENKATKRERGKEKCEGVRERDGN